MNACYPRNTLRGEKFNVRLRILHRLWVIHDTALDNLHSRKGRAFAIHRTSALGAEKAGDLASAVGSLLELLGLSHGLESSFGDEDVSAYGPLALKTLKQSMEDILKAEPLILWQSVQWQRALTCGAPWYWILNPPQRQLPVDIFESQ